MSFMTLFPLMAQLPINSRDFIKNLHERLTIVTTRNSLHQRNCTATWDSVSFGRRKIRSTVVYGVQIVKGNSITKTR